MLSDSRTPLLFKSMDDPRTMTKTPLPGLGVELDWETGLKPEMTPNLGTFAGCYVPCVINIIGIILFLRLPWAIGQIGLLGLLGAVGVGVLMSVLTVLSLSALATNGQMQGGGIYFLISRTLGPALGGGIGFLFYLGYAIGVAFYALGFGTVIQSTFVPICASHNRESTEWFGSCIEPDHKKLLQGGVASTVLMLAMLISLKGAVARAKADLVFFCMQLVAVMYGIISIFVPHGFVATSSFDGVVYANATASFPDHFHENLLPAVQDDDSCPSGLCSFNAICAILFPMFSGILSGANLSGDMRDPSNSIPKGTLWAIVTATVVYTLQAVALAGSIPREILREDQAVFQNGALLTPYVVVAGTLVSVGSSTLGNLYGASKILQAMAQDEISWLLSPFMTKKIAMVPQVAICMTWLIAQVCVLVGDLDIVAPVLTAIFCLSWGCTNLTCAILSSLGSPNFRPTFKFYSKYSAGFGFVLCTTMMLVLDWFYGLLGLVIFFGVTLYLVVTAPAKDWGSMSQEIMFHQVRKLLLGLDGAKSHQKFWKPHILCLADNATPGMLGFCNLVKKGGMLVVGQTLPGKFTAYQPLVAPMIEAWRSYFKNFKLKALPQLTVAPHAALGHRILASAGVCGLSLNSVALALPAEDDGTPHPGMYRKLAHTLSTASALSHREGPTGPSSVSGATSAFPIPGVVANPEFCGLLRELLLMKKNVLLCHGFGQGSVGPDGKLLADFCLERSMIDVWLPDTDPWGDESSAALAKHELVSTLLVQLAETLRMSLKDGQVRHRIRVIQLLHHDSTDTHAVLRETTEAQDKIHAFLREARLVLPARDVLVVTFADVKRHSTAYRELCLKKVSANRLPALKKLSRSRQRTIRNQLMAALCTTSMQIFGPIPPGYGAVDEIKCHAYVDGLRTMLAGLPPTVLVAKGTTDSIISQGL